MQAWPGGVNPSPFAEGAAIAALTAIGEGAFIQIAAVAARQRKPVQRHAQTGAMGQGDTAALMP